MTLTEETGKFALVIREIAPKERHKIKGIKSAAGRNDRRNTIRLLKGCLNQHIVEEYKGFKNFRSTYSWNFLVKAFAGIMKKVFQHFCNLKKGESRFPVSLFRWVVSRRAGGTRGPQQQLLLLVLFQEQVVEEALLGHRPVELLQTAVGEELAEVDPVVHKEAHEIGLVINQRVHHHLFKVTSLERPCIC